MLADLARQVGLALHNSQLDTALQTTLDEVRKQADALQESRARIVASGDAERRRVERNLHDGAQQHLVALAVNLRLARDIIVDDQEAGLEMLDQLAGEVQRPFRSSGSFARDLPAPAGRQRPRRGVAGGSESQPPSRRDRGRWDRPVHVGDGGRGLLLLPRGTAERGKAPPDAHVEVALWEESGGLLFTVSDDGPGFDPEKAQRGHGYVNMADQLGAIGGTVHWDSEVGKGSQVRGSVPLV